jgi:hypothetical protein
MLRMDQGYVIRHKVLTEKLSVRRVARELGVSRNTVRRYVEGATPGVRAPVARSCLVKERVWPRLEQLPLMPGVLDPEGSHLAALRRVGDFSGARVVEVGRRTLGHR